MRDPEPFRWSAQTPGVKVGIVVVSLIVAALAVVVLIILAGLLVHLVRWAWS